jgi:hypothetical protein
MFSRHSFKGSLILLAYVHGAISDQQSSPGTSTCYYPDGSIASDYSYVACSGSGNSACCIPDEGDVCLSKRMLSALGFIYAGVLTTER